MIMMICLKLLIEFRFKYNFSIILRYDLKFTIEEESLFKGLTLV